MPNRRLVVVLLMLAGMASPAQGFDTAHHWELTRNALMREGFGEDAIRVVILQNWLTDFYSAYEANALLRSRIRPEDRSAIENAGWLHFDNLTTTVSVNQYWNTLVLSTASQLYRIAKKRDDDPLELLTVLGITLHAVQDFYTHSNWVTDNMRACKGDQFSDVTWLDAKRDGTMPSRPIFTGTYPPNGPASGPRSHDAINKDSIGRPCWAEAYLLAYKATRQWIRAFAAFVDQHDGNRDLWERCVRGVIVTGADAQTLFQGMDASRRLSLLTGKWQGGPLGNLLGLELTFRSFRDSGSSYKEELRAGRVLAEISGHLRAGLIMGPFPFPDPVFEAAPDDEHILFLRVDQVESTDPLPPPQPLPPPMDPVESIPDYRFFLEIKLTTETTDHTIYQQEFRTVTYDGGITERVPPWRLIWFVPRTAATVDVALSLRNEGRSRTATGAVAESFEVDVTPDPRPTTLYFTYRLADLTCAIGPSGPPGFCNVAHKVTSEGVSIPRGRLRFFVEKPMLKPRS